MHGCGGPRRCFSLADLSASAWLDEKMCIYSGACQPCANQLVAEPHSVNPNTLVQKNCAWKTSHARPLARGVSLMPRKGWVGGGWVLKVVGGSKDRGGRLLASTSLFSGSVSAEVQPPDQLVLPMP